MRLREIELVRENEDRMESTTSQKGRLGDERRFHSRVCAQTEDGERGLSVKRRVDGRRSERERIK